MTPEALAAAIAATVGRLDLELAVIAAIDALAARRYPTAFRPAAPFTVLFVPSDGFLTTALEAEPGLLEHGFARDVVLATPSTLLALLRTVA